MEWKVGDKVVWEVAGVAPGNKHYPIAIKSSDGPPQWLPYAVVSCFEPLPAPLTPLERAVVEKARVQERLGSAPATDGPEDDKYFDACGETNDAVRALIAADKPPSEAPADWVPKVGEWVSHRIVDHHAVPSPPPAPIADPDLAALRDAVVVEFDKAVAAEDGDRPNGAWGKHMKPAVDALYALRAAMAPPAPLDPVAELREAAQACLDALSEQDGGAPIWQPTRSVRARLYSVLAALDKKDGAP